MQPGQGKHLTEHDHRTNAAIRRSSPARTGGRRKARRKTTRHGRRASRRSTFPFSTTYRANPFDAASEAPHLPQTRAATPAPSLIPGINFQTLAKNGPLDQFTWIKYQYRQKKYSTQFLGTILIFFVPLSLSLGGQHGASASKRSPPTLRGSNRSHGFFRRLIVLCLRLRFRPPLQPTPKVIDRYDEGSLLPESNTILFSHSRDSRRATRCCRFCRRVVEGNTSPRRGKSHTSGLRLAVLQADLIEGPGRTSREVHLTFAPRHHNIAPDWASRAGASSSSHTQEPHYSAVLYFAA